MAATPNDGHFEVYWPRAPRRMASKPLAARLDTLAGKHVALMWDYLFRGDEIFDTVKAGLSKQFPGIRFFDWSDVGNIHGSDERQMMAALPGRLKEARVDAVITAVAA